MSSNWDDFKRELQEKGYLEHGKPGFFLKWGLASLTPGRSLLRLGLLSSLMISAALSLALVILFSLSQRTPLPQIALYYFPLLFLFALAVYGLLTAVFRLHPLRNPTRSALFFALITAVLSSFLLFKPFHFFLPARVRPILLVLEIALSALVLFPPLKALAFISWREPDFARYRTPAKVLIILLAVLTAGSLIYLFLPAGAPGAAQRFPLDPLDKPLAVIAVDALEARPVPGNFPVLNDILANGLHVDVRVDGRPSPPVFWTQAATGFPPEANGILSLQAWRLPLVGRALYPLPLSRLFSALGIAEESLASTSGRKKPSFWELASWAGRPSLCVNWWSSWTPKDRGAQVVSNLFLIQKLRGQTGTECQPADLCRMSYSRYQPASEGALWDALVMETLTKTGQGRALVTAYFPGLDVSLFQARALTLEQGLVLSGGLTPSLLAIETGLADLKAKGYRILLVGFSGRQEKPWAWAVFYPVEKEVQNAGAASPLDLMPTILHALNMPMAQDLPGRVLPMPWIITSEQIIPAYPDLSGPRTASGRPPIKELRSLGYLQ